MSTSARINETETEALEPNPAPRGMVEVMRISHAGREFISQFLKTSSIAW